MFNKNFSHKVNYFKVNNKNEYRFFTIPLNYQKYSIKIIGNCITTIITVQK